MFRPLLSTAAFVTGLALGTQAFAQDTPSADTVMATVGGTDITLGHMLAVRAALPAQYDQVPPEVLFKGVLDQLIQQELLSQAHEGEMSRAAALQLENERRAVLAADVAEDVVNADMTEERLQAAYEAQYAGAEEETEYKAAHILVETEEAAQELVSELEGGANFAELAKERSIGPSGPSGGDLGWFGDGVMVPEFFAAVAALEVGAVSAPVQTQFGWHVIKLNETRVKERPTLDAVRDELTNTLRQEAFDAYIAEREAATDVTRTDTSTMDPAVINQTNLLEN
ncbi:Parvulin-like peptidyl-prolyl isomerase [Roseovarius mucosus DSM 17069]|uniref:Parvulin-like PPIase n=1 Tax=Roseovarius mucosus DSM 17069 TaxID=1288298 RepID=A0A0A0HT89_9RHOB|nr:peptidylprolyl isomerase [Roseovarius mucosus]KGM89804.1 Parvulin-like peptidyl-prolyl isomerase [Roseovarius mucosus DSM 17069]